MKFVCGNLSVIVRNLTLWWKLLIHGYTHTYMVYINIDIHINDINAWNPGKCIPIEHSSKGASDVEQGLMETGPTVRGSLVLSCKESSFGDRGNAGAREHTAHSTGQNLRGCQKGRSTPRFSTTQ